MLWHHLKPRTRAHSKNRRRRLNNHTGKNPCIPNPSRSKPHAVSTAAAAATRTARKLPSGGPHASASGQYKLSSLPTSSSSPSYPLAPSSSPPPLPLRPRLTSRPPHPWIGLGAAPRTRASHGLLHLLPGRRDGSGRSFALPRLPAAERSHPVELPLRGPAAGGVSADARALSRGRPRGLRAAGHVREGGGDRPGHHQLRGRRHGGRQADRRHQRRGRAHHTLRSRLHQDRGAPRGADR